MHVTVSLTVTTIPLPSSWLLQGNYPSPSQQKTAQLIGPVSDNVLLSTSSNLTCINYSSSNYTDLTNSAPSFCSTWVLWNSTNNCTNLGIFILCGTYAYSCLPLDPSGPCILVFLTPRTNSLPPGNFPTGKDELSKPPS